MESIKQMHRLSTIYICKQYISYQTISSVTVSSDLQINLQMFTCWIMAMDSSFMSTVSERKLPGASWWFHLIHLDNDFTWSAIFIWFSRKHSRTNYFSLLSTPWLLRFCNCLKQQSLFLHLNTISELFCLISKHTHTLRLTLTDSLHHIQARCWIKFLLAFLDWVWRLLISQ